MSDVGVLPSTPDVGFAQRLIKAIPGLALIVVTMVVIRYWIEPWMNDATLFGVKGWLVKVTHLNYSVSLI